MSTFKIREKKRGRHKNIKTLDAKHKEQINYFKQLEESIPEKRKELEKLKNSVKNIENDPSKFTDIINIQDKIYELEKEIKTIVNKEEEKQYYLNTGELLYQYYDTKHKINKNTHNLVRRNNNNKTIVDFFSKKEVSNNCLKTNKSLSKKDRMKKLSIAGIFNEYLSHVDNSYIKTFDNIDVNICIHCENKLKLYLSEGLMVCEKCGYEEPIIVDSDKPSYKEPPKEVQFFSYKRINHFNEWLAQFQAKESTQIPNELYDKILLEIKKERITNMADLTQIKVRDILKKLKYNKYYEHIPHIINKLNGIPPPVMSRENEEKLRRMFKEIQIPFHKHCPKDRKNFLSYSYVLHKFIQLLGIDEYLDYFPLLKSREKLYQQDRIWKMICEELNWQFIKSI